MRRKLAQDGVAPVITTNSGRVINVLRPNYRDITVHDIVHGLSGEGRFVNQCDETISVGQHTCYVVQLVRQLGGDVVAQKQAWLHDASEAFIRDIPKWFKNDPLMSFYREVEERWWLVLARAFQVPRKMDERIDVADRLMVRFEAREGFKERWDNPPNYPDPTHVERLLVRNCYDTEWRPWDRAETKKALKLEAQRLRLA